MPEPDKIINHVSEDDGPFINSNVIRIQLQKPLNRKWELVTRNCSPGRVFPTIQLFDCEGNLLLETNDDNISVKSSDVEKTHSRKRYSKSLGASDFAKRAINYPVKKTNSVTGDRVYTRFFRRNSSKEEKSSTDDSFDNTLVENGKTSISKDEKLFPPALYGRSLSSPISIYSSGMDNNNSELENSSYKSSDNESGNTVPVYKYITGKAGTLLVCENENQSKHRRRLSRRTSSVSRRNVSIARKNSAVDITPFNSYYKSASSSHVPNGIGRESFSRKLQKSASYHKPKCKSSSYVRRANTDSFKNKYIPSLDNGASIVRNMSFLEIYLKSLPSRNKEAPAWLEEIVDNIKTRGNRKRRKNEKWRRGMLLSDDSLYLKSSLISNDDIDSAVEHEIRRRLKKYHRVMSCSDYWTWKKDTRRKELKRRYSEGASDTSSSESVDEADRILMRLRRRIFQNKKRERKFSKSGSALNQEDDNQGVRNSPSIAFSGSLNQDPYTKDFKETCVDAEEYGLVRGTSPAMGASVGRHGRGSNSTTGAPGGRRRAQSSGDLCAAPDVGSFRDSCSVAGSVSDAATWNSRSLPSHLDGRRRLPCGGCGRCGDCVSSSENHSYNYTRSFGRPPHRHHRKFSHQYGCKLVAGELDPVWKLQDPGCDQGYGSERSPEEEFPPAMPVEDDYEDQEMDLRQMYPFINDDNTFTVRVEKDRRGLGLSVAGGADSNGSGGTSGLVRIRRLYPSQPAWSTGRLRAGDLLLAANGVSLAGLTTYEALEVLRTTPPIVELVVCRPGPELQGRISPTNGTPPAPPIRQIPLDPLNLHAPRPRAPAPTPPSLSPPLQPNNVSDYEEPNPVYDVKYGEFDIVMTKVNGSLGFTLRKEDHSALGHYVRALVREPALSDGRIQPGDRIVAVNDVPMSTMSHGEAVSFLRRCGPVARLRLYRDHCGTPPSPSAASPTTESDTTLITRPKPPLRQEAVNMLCDIAARKLTPDDGNGTCSPCVSPRRYKKPTRNNTGYSQNSDTMHPYSVICPSTTAENSDNEMSQTLSNQSTDTADTTYSLVPDRRPLRPTCFNGQLTDNTKLARPDFLNLGGPPTPVNNRKQRLHFSVAAHGYELNNLDNDLLDAPNVYQDMAQNGSSAYLSIHPNRQLVSEMSNEPMSMPIELIANTDMEDERFSHKNPAYQSAVVHPSNNNRNSGYESSKDDGFKKWKNVNLSPENERKAKFENEEPEKPKIVRYPDENRAPGTGEPRILTVELNRGWNSRLGFSIQCHPESGQSYISAIYSDSVAAKDGRLRQGDIILQVNDENITSMTTPQVIDLLRILRGSICITVLRQ